MNTQSDLKSLIQVSKDGEWGKGEPFANSVEMAVIRGTDFEDASVGNLDDLPVRYIKSDIAERKTLHPYDILLETAGGSGDRPTGRSMFLKPSVLRNSKLPLTCASFSRFIRIDPEKADPEFVYWSLRAKYAEGIMWQYNTRHTGVARFQYTVFSEREIFELPPLPIQRKIADVLSTYDNLIEVNTRRIRILEQMAQSVYREWFGRVDKKSLPEGWGMTTLDKVSKNFDSKRIPLSSMKRAEMEGEYPYYGAAKVLDHVNNYIFDGKYLLIAEDGSVITTDGKPVIQMAYGKFWVNNHTHVLQGAGYVSTEYLYLLLSQVSISGYITGAAQPKITQANLNRIPVVLPPKDLLLKFNQVFEDIFDTIEVLNRKNANLRRTRDLLLPRLVSGEVSLENLEKTGQK